MRLYKTLSFLSILTPGHFPVQPECVPCHPATSMSRGWERLARRPAAATVGLRRTPSKSPTRSVRCIGKLAGIWPCGTPPRPSGTARTCLPRGCGAVPHRIDVSVCCAGPLTSGADRSLQLQHDQAAGDALVSPDAGAADCVLRVGRLDAPRLRLLAIPGDANERTCERAGPLLPSLTQSLRCVSPSPPLRSSAPSRPCQPSSQQASSF